MSDHSEALVLRHDQDGISTLTLNRPQQFNALSDAMLAASPSQSHPIA